MHSKDNDDIRNEAGSAIRGEIGARIKAARLNLNLTQPEVMRRIGWEGPVARLSNYEKGRRLPDAVSIQQLAKGLGKTPEELMFGRLNDKGIPAQAAAETEPEYLLNSLHALRVAYVSGLDARFFDALSIFLTILSNPDGQKSSINSVINTSLPGSAKTAAARAKEKAALNLRGQHGVDPKKKRKRS